MKTPVLIVMSLLLAAPLLAEIKKEFPRHWGNPPEIQTQDYLELPAGYGHGSSTLRNWINAQLAKDAAGGPGAPAPARDILYSQDFQKLPAGPLPDEFMVLGGEFTVKVDGTNHFLELPGAPLDSFAVQFGPGDKENQSVGARIYGTGKSRRGPVFGVGLGGVSGFKLQVSPAKKALELLKDQEFRASVPFEWKSETWTNVRLQIRKADRGWNVEGKAWAAGQPEPKGWAILFVEPEDPPAGRPSILASPFAGTPIWLDDLVVEKAAP
jgi:hypothetical protein